MEGVIITPEMEKFNHLWCIQVRVISKEIASYDCWREVVPIPHINYQYGTKGYEVYKQRLERIVYIFSMIFHLTELMDKWWEHFSEIKKELLQRYQRSILEKINTLDNQMQENIQKYPSDTHGQSLMNEIHDIFGEIRRKYEPFQYVIK
jgi:hypothetical protein